MPQVIEGNVRSFPCTTALAKALRVKISGATLATADAVDGATEIGTTNKRHLTSGVGSGKDAAVLLRSASGTRRFTADGAITAGANFYTADSGKVSATRGDGVLRGIALEATTADGDIFEGLPIYENQAGELKSADKIVTSAQVLALNATPVELVAAPGAGVYLEFVSALLFLDHAGTDYAGIAAGEDLSIKYTDASGAKASADIEATGFMDASADALARATPADTPVLVANAALVLHMLTGEIITGDSPLKVRTFYREVAAADLAAIA